MVKSKSKQFAAAKNLDGESRQIFTKSTSLLIVSITLVLVVTIFLSFTKLKQYENSVKWVIHTNLVKGNLTELLSNLKDAETGQRGFLLTNDSSFLQPYIRTENLSNQVITELDSLVKDNLLQQKNLNNLNRLVNERKIILKRNLGLSSTTTTNPNNVNALLQGSRKMNEVREQAAIMIHLEEQLLQQRTLEKNEIAAITPFTILAFFLVSILVLTLFFIRWRRETQLRIIAQQKAIKLSEASESRIKDFFKEMPAGLCILKGPEHTFEFANKAYFELVGTPDLIGKQVSQVFPEVESQGFIRLLDNVYKTGKTFIGDETPLMLNQSGRKLQYVDFSYQSFKNIDGEIEGILVFAYNVTEKVNARKEIEENEQALQKIATHLKLATDSAIVGTWSLNIQTEKLEWSGLHKKMWGYDEDSTDLTYADWYKLILPADREKAFKEIEEAKINHTTYDVDYCINRANDGDLRCIRSVGKYYYNDKGEAETLTGISIDITEQKEAEKKIKEAHELFETILQNVPSAIYHFDNTGKILYLNEIGANQIGYATPEEVLAEKDVFQLRQRAYETFTVLDEEGKPMPVDQNATGLTFKTGKASEVVSQLIHKKTGASLWLLSTASPLYDHNVGLTKVIVTSTDITLRKTSEQTLRQSEEHFRTFANSIQNLAWIANADGGIYWYNQRWYDYTGTTLEEMQGWGWQKVHHTDHIEKVVEFTKEALKKDEAFELTIPLRRHDGEYRWFLTRAYPVKDVNGNIERWIGTNTDVTEQKSFSEELEKKVNERTRELQEKNLQLDHTNAELSSFNYISNHDLQEPLRKIQMFSRRIIEEEKFSDKTQDYFNRIIASSERMQNLILSLLDFSRTTATELIFKPCDLNVIVEEAKDHLHLSIIEKQAVVKYTNLPTVNGVHVQLSQLFTNLIDNALKYSRPNVTPHVKITSESIDGSKIEHPAANKQKEYQAVKIADNGIGFEKEFVSKIFELFQRLHGRNEYSGTGIGLTIVKKIVTNHNGFIVAEGKPGSGATFTIYIPAT